MTDQTASDSAKAEPSSQQAANKPAATRPKSPGFPPHNAPRVWFLTNGSSSIKIELARKVLDHGDYVVAGVQPQDERKDDFMDFLEEVKQKPERAKKVRAVQLDPTIIGQCQAAIAEAVHAFGRVDMLVGCTSDAVIGTVEELSASPSTQALTRQQFETNYFANVNIIRAALPQLRKQRNGHLIMVTGITAHLGTPGLGMYCASQWAIEGYCDSLAYEIAPFNIKMTIIQPNLEIAVLTGRILSAPPMKEYGPDENAAPLSRELLSGLLDRLAGKDRDGDEQSPELTNNAQELTGGDALQSSSITSVVPQLAASMKIALIAETVHAMTAIGGHDNPPARHIVGFEGVASVKEKLKTVSEELEDFIEVSTMVDIGKEEEAQQAALEGL